MSPTFFEWDVRHEQVLLPNARLLDHVSLRIDNLGTSKTRQVPVAASHIGPNHPKPVFSCKRNVPAPSCGIHFQRSALVRQTIVVGMKRALAPWTAIRRANSG